MATFAPGNIKGEAGLNLIYFLFLSLLEFINCFAQAGRISHLEPIELPEEERQAKLDEMNTDDPVAERLKGIMDDKR